MLQLISTLQVLGVKVHESLKRRMADDSGQTAAEYMGIVVIVAIIVAAIATSGVGTTISGDITSKIGEIFNHK